MVIFRRWYRELIQNRVLGPLPTSSPGFKIRPVTYFCTSTVCVFSFPWWYLAERLKREERRREELYRQYFEEIQRRFDAERPVDCSVIVVNKQTK